MKNFIAKDKELIILSLDITNATKCCVTENITEEDFEVVLKTDEKYNENDYVDLFATSGSGILFFTSKIKKNDDKKLKILNPEKYTLIQRREYTRAEINKNILINNNQGKNIRATIKDISAGGMSLITNEEMQKTQSYKIDLNLEQNLEFSCHFKPIRIKILNDEKYSISGKFSLIKNIDRIALAQYCLKKASEHQNKEK